MSPPPRTFGSVILLNGTSSAGKSTLATAVQDVMDAPYLSLGIDCFFEALPQRYLARLAPDVVPPPQADDGLVWVCTEPGGHGFRELRVGEGSTPPGMPPDAGDFTSTVRYRVLRPVSTAPSAISRN